MLRRTLWQPKHEKGARREERGLEVHRLPQTLRLQAEEGERSGRHGWTSLELHPTLCYAMPSSALLCMLCTMLHYTNLKPQPKCKNFVWWCDVTRCRIILHKATRNYTSILCMADLSCAVLSYSVIWYHITRTFTLQEPLLIVNASQYVIWCDIAWYCLCDTIWLRWYAKRSWDMNFCHTIWYDVFWYDMALCGGHGKRWYDAIGDMVWFHFTWHCMLCHVTLQCYSKLLLRNTKLAMLYGYIMYFIARCS